MVIGTPQVQYSVPANRVTNLTIDVVWGRLMVEQANGNYEELLDQMQGISNVILQ